MPSGLHHGYRILLHCYIYIYIICGSQCFLPTCTCTMPTMETNDKDDFKLRLENISSDIIALAKLNYIVLIVAINHY